MNLMKLTGGFLAGMMFLTGCSQVTEMNKTQAVATTTPEIISLSGNGEFSAFFTLNSVQNLDTETKTIVARNLELINQECSRDLPGRMVEGSEKYLFARNKSNETFIWGFCDVVSPNAPKKTVVSLFTWMTGPSGETTKVSRDLVAFDDGTLGYVEINGNSRVILKIINDNMMEVYDYNETVVSRQIMTPETIDFFDKIKEVSTEAFLTATEMAATIVETPVEGISSVEEIQTRIDDYLSGKEDWSVTGPNKDYLFTYNQTMPLSYFTIGSDSNGGGAPELYKNCKQQGVYLGSYISDLDNSIIVVLGSQNVNKQSIIEIFTVGFSVEPDDLPMDPMTGYVFVNVKWPSWLTDQKWQRVTGLEVPGLLKEKENQIIMWTWVCQQDNQELINDFIAEAVQGAGISQKTLEWFFEKSKTTEGLLDWLNNPGVDVPYGVFTNVKEVDLRNIDAKKIPPILDLRIPGNINK